MIKLATPGHDDQNCSTTALPILLLLRPALPPVPRLSFYEEHTGAGGWRRHAQITA